MDVTKLLVNYLNRSLLYNNVKKKLEKKMPKDQEVYVEGDSEYNDAISACVIYEDGVLHFGAFLNNLFE